MDFINPLVWFCRCLFVSSDLDSESVFYWFWDDFRAILASFWGQKSVLEGPGDVLGALGVPFGAQGGSKSGF